MQHKIGTNYSSIIATRRNKNQYPHVIRLRKTVDLPRLTAEVNELLTKTANDLATTETQYRLNNTKGEKFIHDYEEFIKHYSHITFHKITDEAEALAKSITKPLDDYTPKERLRGMIDTGSKFYHPYYDERNYTVFTDNATGYIREILETFEATTCRSAIVVLKPGQRISRHCDVSPEYVIRCHIPLSTNLESTMGFRTPEGWMKYHMPADGSIYAVNSGIEHWAENIGDETRYQMRICLMSQEDTVDAETVEPCGFISHEDFKGHHCE